MKIKVKELDSGKIFDTLYNIDFSTEGSHGCKPGKEPTCAEGLREDGSAFVLEKGEFELVLELEEEIGKKTTHP